MDRLLRVLLATLSLACGISGFYLAAYGDMEPGGGRLVETSQKDVGARPENRMLSTPNDGGDPIREVEAAPQESGDPYGIDQLHYLGLDEDGRVAYDALYQSVVQRRASFSVTLPDPDALEMALRALMADHPEFFWLSGSCTYRKHLDGSTDIEIMYNVDADRIDAVQATIDLACTRFLADVPPNSSTYDKVRMAYEWVIAETDYDDASPQNQNIQSVFVDHMSVCAGYTKALQYLLRQMGIPCAYVRGVIESSGVDHAWNLVSIDGTPTYVDATWGDPTYASAGGEQFVGNISYDYLCFTTTEMERIGHRLTTSGPIPPCDSDKYDYYRLNGLLFDVYDRSLVDEAFRRAFDAGETRASFKFSNDEAFLQAVAALEDRSLLQGAFVDAMASQHEGERTVQYHSAFDARLRILIVMW